MNTDDISKARTAIARATPGPWTAEDDAVFAPDHVIDLAGGYTSRNRVAIATERDADAALIAIACNAIPGLLDEVESLRRDRDLWCQRAIDAQKESEFWECQAGRAVSDGLDEVERLRRIETAALALRTAREAEAQAWLAWENAWENRETTPRPWLPLLDAWKAAYAARKTAYTAMMSTLDGTVTL